MFSSRDGSEQRTAEQSLQPRTQIKTRRRHRLRRRIYEVLESGPIGDKTSHLVNGFIVLLIVVSLTAVILETDPDLKASYAGPFTAIEIVSLIIFTIEYCARVWIAAEHSPTGLDPVKERIRFVTSPTGLIDLAGVAPFWIALAYDQNMEILLLFRIVRFMKLTRYSPGMRSLLDALYSERRALVGCFILLFGVAVVAATLMYAVEGDTQPDKFGTIPKALWWAIVTLGTIGYGDVVPVTILGKSVATVTILAGLIMMALPIGILATAFSNEIHRRDFVVTWGLVARVPLFSKLSATGIAEIMKLLRARKVDQGATIVRRGQPAHSMYFIAAGEVEIRLKHKRVHLGPNHFFGEVAALRRTSRSATVVATKPTSLLVLDISDLEFLMDRNPDMAAVIREVAQQRLDRQGELSQGDLLIEELEGKETDLDAR